MLLGWRILQSVSCVLVGSTVRALEGQHHLEIVQLGTSALLGLIQQDLLMEQTAMDHVLWVTFAPLQLQFQFNVLQAHITLLRYKKYVFLVLVATIVLLVLATSQQMHALQDITAYLKQKVVPNIPVLLALIILSLNLKEYQLACHVRLVTTVVP